MLLPIQYHIRFLLAQLFLPLQCQVFVNQFYSIKQLILDPICIEKISHNYHQVSRQYLLKPNCYFDHKLINSF